MPRLTDIASALWQEYTNPRAARIWKHRLRTALLGISCILLAGWVTMLAASSGSFDGARNWLSETTTNASLKAGFKVTEIAVTGRQYTTAAEILAATDTQIGSPILNFDPETAKNALEQLPWVQTASVLRRLPGLVLVNITERKPVALWQNNKKFSLIDRDGKVLTTDIPQEFKKLPIVVGVDAPKAVSEVLVLLMAEPEIAKRLDAAVRVGGRRWDLHLHDGINVKLPEDNIGYALRRLAARQQEAKLLDRGISVVDLRFPDKIIVRTEKNDGETGDKKQKSI